MKIYEMNIQERMEIISDEKELENFTPIAETDKEIHVSNAIKIGKQFYTVCCRSDSYALVEKLDFSNSEKELYGEDEIICPHCKNSVLDSWEYDDYEDRFKCSYCGSVFSYERITNPTYNMKLIKKGEILKI